MSIERLNNYLARDYGYFNGQYPLYRLVWSEDQFEKRETYYTDEGLELLHKEVRLLPKYKQHIHNKFILERCLGIPDFVQTDLVENYSYEPLHVFKIGRGDSYEFDTFYGACKFIIEQVHEAAKRAYYGSNYKSPEDKMLPDELLYTRKLEVDKMYEFLFGNESEVTDNLNAGSGIIVPNSYNG